MENYKSFNELMLGTASPESDSESVVRYFPVDNMMVPVDRAYGQDINMPSDDHEPPHVEIKRGDEKCGKLPVNPEDKSKLTYLIKKIPHGDLRKLEKHIEKKHDEYMKRWNEIRKKKQG